jgi:hypothetical protein
MADIVEPWLRGTLKEVEPVRRAVLHALQLAGEDAERWCAGLCGAEIFARPAGLPPVAFQLRHIARSLDRLLTYAESSFVDSSQSPVGPLPALREAQMAALASEVSGEGSAAEVMAEFRTALARAMERVLAVAPEQFAELRGVGKKKLPTTVAGLLIHCAEHTQRHVGQMITTVKVVTAKPKQAGDSV